MGPESGSSRRVESRTCAQRKGGQDVGRHGHAEGAERQASQLQDTARAEGSRGTAEECYGERWGPEIFPLAVSILLTSMHRSQQEKPGHADLWRCRLTRYFSPWKYSWTYFPRGPGHNSTYIL